MNVCVFCGSSPGRRDVYLQAARDLGAELAARDLGLVYGGASIGLMGAVADAVLANGGKAIGVIPQALADVELAHAGLSELYVVGSMHERKAKMEQITDYFIALPGGFGTLDESFEILTWAQLGIHQKPIGLLNVDHYFDGLLEFTHHQVAEQFVKPAHRDMLHASDSAADLLDILLTSHVPASDKWVTPAP